MIKEIEIKATLKRLVKELDEKINIFIQARKNRGENALKQDFFQELKHNKVEFPIAKATYYNYTRTINPKCRFSLQTMLLDDFYKICQYTDVSADYYLGFIETKRKETSAPQVTRDFGLSDEAMDTLSQIKQFTPECKGEVSSDLVNCILEDKEFWNELDLKLPAYISCLVYHVDERNIDAARYGVMRVFEELLDRITTKCISSDLPNAEIDPAAPFEINI